MLLASHVRPDGAVQSQLDLSWGRPLRRAAAAAGCLALFAPLLISEESLITNLRTEQAFAALKTPIFAPRSMLLLNYNWITGHSGSLATTMQLHQAALAGSSGRELPFQLAARGAGIRFRCSPYVAVRAVATILHGGARAMTGDVSITESQARPPCLPGMVYFP